MPGLDPLRFDIEIVQERHVTALVGVRDHTATWDQVAVVLGHEAILIHVDADYDEIIAEIVPNSGRHGTWEPIRPLDGLLGRPLGWA